MRISDYAWREVGPMVHAMGSNIIQDKGYLRTAAMSGGRFLFSPVGAGVLPLVFLGTLPEITTALRTHPQCSVENIDRECDGLYMSIQPYTPGKRFSGLFPVGDAIKAVTNGITSIAGAGIGNVFGAEGWTQVVGVVGDGITTGYDLHESRKKGWLSSIFSSEKGAKHKSGKKQIYVKMNNYYTEQMSPLQKNKISLPDLAGIIEKAVAG